MIKKTSTPTDLIRECILFIVNQYKSQDITQFVLLVDESVAIQRRLDPDNKIDLHKTLRDALLDEDMILNNGNCLKVDLVMSG
jgi:hypothetical protein